MKRILLTLMLVVIALCSCTETLDMKSIVSRCGDMQIYTNLQINSIDWSGPLQTIKPEDAKHKLFVQWLEEHPSGWRNDYATYEFPKYMLSGSEVIFCVYDDFVLLQYEDYYLTRKAKLKEFDFMGEGLNNTFSLSNDSIR